ncbi:hypothetical protein [Nocardia sp. NPDC060259]|uniref:hypothetical protein n=1 Tax=Nocardia sp. NPDC060259 TaxID=3347088 RepID=UPI003647B461
MTTLGFVVAVGLPLAVLLGVIVWPERIPKDRTVEAIRARIENEARQPNSPPGGAQSPR